MEAMLSLLTLHLHVKKESEQGALRRRRNTAMLEDDLTDHLRILREFKLTPSVTTVFDCMEAQPRRSIQSFPSDTIRFYTDG